MKIFPSRINKGFTASWIVGKFVFIFFLALFCFSSFEVRCRIETFWCLMVLVKKFLLHTGNPLTLLEKRTVHKLRITIRAVIDPSALSAGENSCYWQAAENKNGLDYGEENCHNPCAFTAPATSPVQTSRAIKGSQQLNIKLHPTQNREHRRCPDNSWPPVPGADSSRIPLIPVCSRGILFHCHMYQP